MGEKVRLRKKIIVSLVVLISVLTIVGTISGMKLFAQAGAEGGQQQAAGQATVQSAQSPVAGYAFIGAAVAFGFGAIGAGIAIGGVGAAAMGAVAEKPEIAGQALIFVALAEGLVVFGFITALMILGKA
jgi:V/A-type H+-transporting ATPase subunit K